MRRTVREPDRDRLLVAAVWTMLVGIALTASPNEWATGPDWARIPALALVGVTLTGLVAVTAWVIVTRATIKEGVLTLYALRRGEQLRVSLDSVVGYLMDQNGAWWVHTRPDGMTCTDPAARTRVAVREPWELHRFFVETAPKRLGGRLWRFTGTPSDEEFINLWAFDVERFAGRFLPQIAGVMTGALIGILITHRHTYGPMGSLLSPLLFPAVGAWERIDVTGEGIVRRSPIRRRTIPWSEVRAVFREGNKAFRSFVIVGAGAAIHIPSHLAQDEDLMKKMFYSLPSPVLCVNFDESTFRGYKRRQSAVAEKAAQGIPLPAVTT